MHLCSAYSGVAASSSAARRAQRAPALTSALVLPPSARRLRLRAPDGGFDAFWAAINKELNFLHLEMRRVSHVCEPGDAPELYVGIVNKARAARTAWRRLASMRAANPRWRAGARRCVWSRLRRLSWSMLASLLFV